MAKLAKEGYEFIMIGHKGHPEVEGTMGQLDSGIHLVEDVADVARIAPAQTNKLAVVTQTTLSVNDAAEDNWLIKNYPMTSHYWIGATNDGVQGQWRWTSSEVFSYTNWGANLNNLGGNENCAQYYSVTAGGC